MRVASAAVLFGGILLAASPAMSNPQAAQRPGPVSPAPAEPASSPASPASARTFDAPVGLLFNTVRPDRVADFEKVVAALQDALAKSVDDTVRAQARGWRVFRAAEPGPNGTVLFVFAIDPVVPGADYGLGRILAEAFPDAAELQEIWTLYTGAVTSGGTLLNLTPVGKP